MSNKIIGVTVGTTISPSKMKKELQPVQTINGVGPNENGDIQIEGNGVVNGVAAISITEAADGTVTMVNTLESGTETIVITPDADGNPASLTYNGKEIPISWAVSE